MWNLIKNVFRSLAKNKIAIIGLTFLIFLSVGMFTVLQSTTTNIDTTYDKVSSQGNQHDFTVSEKYNTGLFQYKPGNFGDTKGAGQDKEGYIVTWPDVVQTGTNLYTKTYYYKLDAKEGGDTLIDQYYSDPKHKDDPNNAFIYRTFTVVNNNPLTYTSDTDHKSDMTYPEIQQELSKSVEDGQTRDIDAINSEINTWSDDLITEVTETNSPLNSYLTENWGSEVYFRNFTSLKINNAPGSNDKVFYDVVQSSIDDKVDKEILFDNEDFDNLGWYNFSTDDWTPVDGINRDGVKNLLRHNLPEWDDLILDENQQKFVRNLFGLLVKGYTGTSDAGKGFSTLVNAINDALVASPNDFPQEIKDNYSKYKSEYIFKDLNDKKYSYVASFEWKSVSTLPFTWLLDDWTTNFCICAPQYMQKHNLKPLDVSKLMQSDKDYQEWIKDHNDITNERQRFISWMNSLNQEDLQTKIIGWGNDEQYKNNVIKVGGEEGSPYFILSAGITGDYVYPVVSISNPIPNTEKECIIFVNKSGYESIRASFQGNETEKYVVGKFVNPKHGSEILNEINDWARDNMSWPDNIRAAYMANDLSCTLNAAAFRINYIPQLVNKIDMLSYFLTIFVLIVGLIISIIVIRRYVSNSRTTIGVMRANGMRRRWIALSMTPFALIPSLVGGICGYLLGTFLQAPTMMLFSAYWTLPTSLLAFSWSSLILSIFIPLLVFVIAAYASTYIMLREKTTDLMKSGSEYKLNWVSKIAKKPFKHFRVISRFRASIAFSSLWKLLILAIMSSLAMSTLVFGLTLNGKFDSATSVTSETRNYNFAVDLYTPTTQGGQYIPIDATDFGRSGFQKSARNAGMNFLPNPYFDGTKVPGDTSFDHITDDSKNNVSLFIKQYFASSFGLVDAAHLTSNYIEKSFQDGENSYANLFLPFFGDAIGQKTDLLYLKNRQSTMLTLDYIIGALGLTSNPWDIAASLMPQNLKNICESKYNKIIYDAGTKAFNGEGGWDAYKKFFNQIDNGDGTYSYQINQNNALDWTGFSLSHDYINFIIKLYEDEVIAKNDDGSCFDYLCLYNSVPLTKEDETYTYLDAKQDSSSFNGISSAKIIGIDVAAETDSNNTIKYVNLVDKNNNSLIEKLDYKNVKNGDPYPLIINELVAKKYHLSVGKTVKFKINNLADRFMKTINEDDQNNRNSLNEYATFKIVGISKSRENEEFFTDQQIANYILGLRSKYNVSEDYPYGKTYSLNSYYVDYNKTNKCSFTVDDGSESVKFKTNDTILNNIDLLKSTDDEYNVIPYGFNGYFTSNTSGGKPFTSNLCYSPSGLYMPSASIASNGSKDVLKYGGNLYIACQILGIDLNADKGFGKEVKDWFESWQSASTSDKQAAHASKLPDLCNEFVSKFEELWGPTDYVTLVTNALDSSSSDVVYKTMSNTISQIEIVVLVVIVFMVFFVVLLMSSIIIADCKKLSALLSSLGYTDWENAISFMSIYIPVIVIGLAIAIPITMALTSIFQLAVMNGIGLLLDASVKWYFYIAGASTVVFELMCSIIFSWISLKRSSLTNMIK